MGSVNAAATLPKSTPIIIASKCFLLFGFKKLNFTVIVRKISKEQTLLAKPLSL